MKRGSLTVFFSMILIFVMVFIFTMAECIRIYAMTDMSKRYVTETAESVFSEYNPYLWTNYRILAVDLGYGTAAAGTNLMESRALEFCGYNTLVDDSYMQLTPDECTIEKYALLTDNGAAGVRAMGVKAAKEGLVSQVLDAITDKSNEINSTGERDVTDMVENGKGQLNEAKQKNANARQAAANDDDPSTDPGAYPVPEEVEDNPLDTFDALKQSFAQGVLSTVIEDMGQVSAYAAAGDALPSKRTNNSGTMDAASGGGLIDKAVFMDYLFGTYGYFGQEKNCDGFCYELEYLVAAKNTDKENLAAVVERILLMREAANYTTILSDAGMMAQAEAISITLTSFAPALQPVVMYALIGAWAYAESTLDLRLLLSGGKVPAIKNSSQWTTDIFHLSAIVDVSCKAKDCGTGLSYRDYLLGMLSLTSQDTLGMRCCDVMEDALKNTADYSLVRMDNMVFAADIPIIFSGNEIFLSVFAPWEEISGNVIDGYEIKNNRLMSYL